MHNVIENLGRRGAAIRPPLAEGPGTVGPLRGLCQQRLGASIMQAPSLRWGQSASMIEVQIAEIHTPAEKADRLVEASLSANILAAFLLRAHGHFA
jgi:hypothetical protein